MRSAVASEFAAHGRLGTGSGNTGGQATAPVGTFTPVATSGSETPAGRSTSDAAGAREMPGGKFTSDAAAGWAVPSRR